jgi:hypothetical protein
MGREEFLRRRSLGDCRLIVCSARLAALLTCCFRMLRTLFPSLNPPAACVRRRRPLVSSLSPRDSMRCLSEGLIEDGA